ncbi:hypothetical protein SKAU_G00013960 [Synaphobranchus kaupii]|uniref:Uncharacterized protein n=1 Tax=Synaphobranchus kaupii TaxID=118154 RepID=A0A9Q1GBI8_SYNKA|nr:hypothetical protein SKAU_G00013960 [Synaphobranchus kaupii]
MTPAQKPFPQCTAPGRFSTPKASPRVTCEAESCTTGCFFPPVPDCGSRVCQQSANFATPRFNEPSVSVAAGALKPRQMSPSRVKLWALLLGADCLAQELKRAASGRFQHHHISCTFSLGPILLISAMNASGSGSVSAPSLGLLENSLQFKALRGLLDPKS